MPTLLATPTAISLGTITASTWMTGIATGVPAGTTGVILSFNTGTGGGAITVRATGSTDTQVSSTPVSATGQAFYHIGVDSTGHFDWYTSVATGISCWLIGYYGAEAVFFSNAISLAIPTTAFTNYNMASTCPGATAVFLEHLAGYQMSCRMNGSSDSWTPSTSSQHLVMGVDSGQIFQAKRSLAPTAFYCHGYMTAGITWNLNAVNTGALTAGIFQNLPAESGAIGYIYIASGTVNMTVCSTACTVATYNPQRTINLGFAQATSAGSQAQVNPATTALTLYEAGYFVSTLATYPGIFMRKRRAIFGGQNIWGRLF